MKKFEFPKISKKTLKDMKKFCHTDKCTYYITGGFRRSIDDHSTPHKVWVCSDDCPIKKWEAIQGDGNGL